MQIQKISDFKTENLPYTALLYCAPGVGKSTAIGLAAERSEGNTLVLDVDRTIERSVQKHEVVKNTDKLFIRQIDNVDTWNDWANAMKELEEMRKSGELEKLDIRTIAVDNISELERCILSALGAAGKNKGIPAMGDYQYMQFKLVNSLRFMKSLGVNIIWTAWETVDQVTDPMGNSYSRLVPKISVKIVDNICGLCDVVGKIAVKKDPESGNMTHGIILDAQQNIYAKNQIDTRKGCLVEDFVDFKYDKEDK